MGLSCARTNRMSGRLWWREGASEGGRTARGEEVESTPARCSTEERRNAEDRGVQVGTWIGSCARLRGCNTRSSRYIGSRGTERGRWVRCVGVSMPARSPLVGGG
jgi:hypothetical protein